MPPFWHGSGLLQWSWSITLITWVEIYITIINILKQQFIIVLLYLLWDSCCLFCLNLPSDAFLFNSANECLERFLKQQRRYNFPKTQLDHSTKYVGLACLTAAPTTAPHHTMYNRHLSRCCCWAFYPCLANVLTYAHDLCVWLKDAFVLLTRNCNGAAASKTILNNLYNYPRIYK